MRRDFTGSRYFTKTSVVCSYKPHKIIYISQEGTLVEWETSLAFNLGTVIDKSKEFTNIRKVIKESEKRIYEYVMLNCNPEFDL